MAFERFQQSKGPQNGPVISLDVDGHPCSFARTKKVGKLYSARFEFPAPATEETWVSDANGHWVMIVIAQPGTSLAGEIRWLLPALRKVIGDARWFWSALTAVPGCQRGLVGTVARTSRTLLCLVQRLPEPFSHEPKQPESKGHALRVDRPVPILPVSPRPATDKSHSVSSRCIVDTESHHLCRGSGPSRHQVLTQNGSTFSYLARPSPRC